MNSAKYFIVWAAVLIVPLACSSQQPDRRVEPGSTDLPTQEPTAPDILAVVQEMARDILNCKAIGSPDADWLHTDRDAVIGPEKSHRPRIAVLPVRNRSRFRMDTQLITRAIQDELNQRSKERLDFIDRSVIDRIIEERRKKDENIYDGIVIGKLAGADFFLAGELHGHDVYTSRAASDLVQYSFRLVDTNSAIEAWSKGYLVEKIEKPGKIYRSKD